MSDPAGLNAAARQAIAAPENDVLVSAVTAWEISIKQALGRLVFPLDDYADLMRRMGFEALPVLAEHGIAAGRLPRHHDDPFDRLLIAQARAEGLALVTQDAVMERYDVKLL